MKRSPDLWGKSRIKICTTSTGFLTSYRFLYQWIELNALNLLVLFLLYLRSGMRFDPAGDEPILIISHGKCADEDELIPGAEGTEF